MNSFKEDKIENLNKNDPTKIKVLRIILLLLYLFAVGFMLYSAADSGDKSADTSSGISELIRKLPIFSSVDAETFESYVRKLIGHFGGYFFLGIISYFLFKINHRSDGFNLTFSLTSGFFWCAITEIIQIFSENRGPAFQDVILNFEGFMSAIVIVNSIFLLVKRIKKIEIRDFEKTSSFINLGVTLFTISAFFLISDLGKVILNCTFVCIAITLISVILLYFALKKQKKLN